MGKYFDKLVFPIAILAFTINILYVWNSPALSKVVMGNDEYFFYRTTMNLPHYNTKGSWVYEDVAPNPSYATDDIVKELFDKAYTKSIWIHPLVTNYIAYPVAKLFNNPVLEIKWLRLFDVFVIITTVVLMLDIIRRRTNQYIAAISVFPMMVGWWLLGNGIMFYNDLFMWLFFALTLWVIEVKPNSKWVIPLSMITVLSKMNSVLLLIPIALFLNYKTRRADVKAKVIISSLVAVLGFFVFQAVVAKDALYMWHHWAVLNAGVKGWITHDVLPNIESYIMCWGLYVSIPVIFVGAYQIIKRRIRSYYPFLAFCIITMLYGFGWGFFAYQVFPIMYASMFMMPVVIPLLVNVEESEKLRYELE